MEEWIVQSAAAQGKMLSHDNARFIMELSGDDRNILQMQLDKIILFIGESSENHYGNYQSTVGRH